MTRIFRRAGTAKQKKSKKGPFSMYVPTASFGLVQRSTGTSDRAVAGQMATLVETLKNKGDWMLLDAIGAKTVTFTKLLKSYIENDLEALRAELNAGEIATYYDDWIKELNSDGLTEASQKLYEQRMRKLLASVKFTNDLTPGKVRTLLANISVSPGTKRQYLDELSSFCNFLVGRGKLAANPTTDRRLVKRPRKNKPRREWRSVEVDMSIVEAADPRFRAAIALAHATGADRETLTTIKVKHLDFEDCTADLHGTKTESRRRLGVPIEAWAIPILKAHCADMQPNDRAFAESRADSITRAHKDACERVGVENYWLRDARHSYAIRALLSGRSLWEVSDCLGHSNIATTASIYVHFDKRIKKLLKQSSVED